jgi:general secretion pathway protein C
MGRYGINLLNKIRALSPFTVLAALLVGFALVQTARLLWTIITPVAPLGIWRIAAPQSMPPSQRAALFKQYDPFFPVQSEFAAADVITALPLTLFGIRSNEASGSGSAIIADAAGLQTSFATGEEIMAGVTLHSVAFDHAVISNNGALEKLYLDQSVDAPLVGTGPSPGQAAAPARSAPSSPVAAGSGIKLTAETAARNIGLAARNENGKVTGLVVSARDDGAVLKAAGLREGDIIVSVNGRPVSAPADLAKSLRPGASVSVEVERGAQKLPLAIFMEKQ